MSLLVSTGFSGFVCAMWWTGIQSVLPIYHLIHIPGISSGLTITVPRLKLFLRINKCLNLMFVCEKNGSLKIEKLLDYSV